MTESLLASKRSLYTRFLFLFTSKESSLSVLLVFHEKLLKLLKEFANNSSFGNWAKQSRCSLGTDVKIRFFSGYMNVRLWMHQTDVRTAPSLNLPPPVTKSLLEAFCHLSSATLFFSSIYRLLRLLHFNTHSFPAPLQSSLCWFLGNNGF